MPVGRFKDPIVTHEQKRANEAYWKAKAEGEEKYTLLADNAVRCNDCSWTAFDKTPSAVSLQAEHHRRRCPVARWLPEELQEAWRTRPNETFPGEDGP